MVRWAPTSLLNLYTSNDQSYFMHTLNWNIMVILNLNKSWKRIIALPPNLWDTKLNQVHQMMQTRRREISQARLLILQLTTYKIVLLFESLMGNNPAGKQLVLPRKRNLAMLPNLVWDTKLNQVHQKMQTRKRERSQARLLFLQWTTYRIVMLFE